MAESPTLDRTLVLDQTQAAHSAFRPEESHAAAGFTLANLTPADPPDSQLAAANATALSDLPATFGGNPAQELLSVQTRLLRPGYAVGVARYGRHPLLSRPAVKAFLLAHTRSTRHGLRYYQSPDSFDSNGRPNGTIRGWRLLSATRADAPAYAWFVEADLITIPTLLDADPSAAVAPLRGRLNTDSFTLSELAAGETVPAGKPIGPHELWFTNLSVTPVEVVGPPPAVKYRVEYQFLWTSAPGWVEQTLIPDAVPPVPMIAFTFVPGGLLAGGPAKTAAFKTQFPMHAISP